MKTAAAAGLTVPEICSALRKGGTPAPAVQPLTIFRAAERFERLRDAVNAASRKPIVFLATLGPVFWRRARATFSSGFFGAAGMDIIDNIGFDSPEKAAAAAMQTGADVVVLCSDDESYRDLTPALMKAFSEGKKNPILVVAGYPKDDITELEQAGVDAFIHVKVDAAQTLERILEALAINVQ
jgi:methylmalonyl-CoA mutase